MTWYKVTKVSLKHVCGKIVLISTGLVVIMLLLYSNMPHLLFSEFKHTINRTILLGANTSMKYIVNTPACRIPWIDPYHPSIKDILNDVPNIDCHKWNRTTYTYQIGQTIFINWTKVEDSEYKDTFTHCKYYSIIRPPNPESNDDFKILKKQGKRFVNNATVTDIEFVKVTCFDDLLVPIHWNYFMFPITHKSVLERCQRNKMKREKRKEIKETLNVLLVGIDSMSKQNAIRFLPKTRKYLIETLGAVEMNGYAKVLENTLVNVVPILTGKFVEELVGEPYDERIYDPMENYRYIWNDFADEGYMNMFAEDAPHIGTFDYDKSGFVKTPTDYFPRHFELAIGHPEVDIEHKWHKDVCVHNKLETELLLEYTTNFLTTATDYPHFGYVFTSGLSHDTVELSSLSDEPHLKFLQNLQRKGILETTVLFFFSDHGMRFGDIRQTFAGRIEESLPYLFIYLPLKIKQKYPYLLRNLHSNANKLTTPFDMHETMREILNFTGNEQTNVTKARGYSFFSQMPKSRSCTEAEIHLKFCVCTEESDISVSNEVLQLAGLKFVEYINMRIHPVSDLCASLTLKSVNRTTVKKATPALLESLNIKLGYDRISKYLKYISIYTIVIKTLPGNAIFEGDILHIKKNAADRFVVTDNVVRLNKYGSQSDCLTKKHSLIRRFCYCSDT